MFWGRAPRALYIPVGYLSVLAQMKHCVLHRFDPKFVYAKE